MDKFHLAHKKIGYSKNIIDPFLEMANFLITFPETRLP
jgi:hypothetical protein